jgi:hypothetical protein
VETSTVDAASTVAAMLTDPPIDKGMTHPLAQATL